MTYQFIGALILTMLGTEPTAAPSKNITTIALWPTTSLGVLPATQRQIEQHLQHAIEQRSGFVSVSAADLRDDLLRQGFDPNDCTRDTRCMQKLGLKARADKVLVIELNALHKQLGMDLQLLDTKNKHPILKRHTPLPKRLTQDLFDHLFIALLTPEQYIGALDIDCSPKGAAIFIDNKAVGLCPLTNIIKPIAAGSHVLRIAMPKHQPIEQLIDVAFKRLTGVRVDLEAQTIITALLPAWDFNNVSTEVPPPQPTWLKSAAWVTGGLGLAALGVGTFFTTYVEYANRQARQLETHSTTLLDTNKRLELEHRISINNQRGNMAEQLQWMSLGLGATSLLVSGALFFWPQLTAVTLPEIVLQPNSDGLYFNLQTPF